MPSSSLKTIFEVVIPFTNKDDADRCAAVATTYGGYKGVEVREVAK